MAWKISIWWFGNASGLEPGRYVMARVLTPDGTAP